ncbi:MAG: RNA polymerase sigma factor [Pyrinomonadaceae bacterium]
MSSYQTALQNEGIITRFDGQADTLRLAAERTDAHLVELVLAGDETAFEQIFHRHKRLVASIACRYFRRQEEIEEMMQVAFAKAYAELNTFRGKYEASFPSWLVTITANSCLDTIRKQQRRPERLECELSKHEAQTLLDLAGPNARHAEQELSDGDLAEKLLSHLPPAERELLEMLHAYELSVAEIAERLGCSKANVKIRAWRARGALRKILRKYL